MANKWKPNKISHGRMIIDQDGDIMSVDSTSGASSFISSAHVKVHEGGHFYFSGHAGKDNTETLDVTFTTAASVETHMRLIVTGTGITTVELYEGASSITSGSTVTVYNNNRASDATSSLVAKEDPTIGSDGTKIYEQKTGVAGTSFQAPIAGMFDSTGELVLPASTAYLLRLTAGNNGVLFSYVGSWYEV